MGFLSSLIIWASLSFMFPVASAAVVRFNRSESYDMPLTWNSFGFTTQTSIGTPPQSVISIVDWTWNSHYLVTTLCKGSPLNTFDCLAPGQSLFNQTKSSTFKNLSDQYPSQTWNPNHFFFNLDLKVQYASDVEIIGPSKTTVRLQAGDTQFQQPFVQPFNGIFGLSPVFPERKCEYLLLKIFQGSPDLKDSVRSIHILASLESPPIPIPLHRLPLLLPRVPRRLKGDLQRPRCDPNPGRMPTRPH